MFSIYICSTSYNFLAITSAIPGTIETLQTIRIKDRVEDYIFILTQKVF